jgi:hypothetical protein
LKTMEDANRELARKLGLVAVAPKRGLCRCAQGRVPQIPKRRSV